MQFSVYQESRLGGRKNNQDRMGYVFTHDAVLLLLADGMGGHIQGEMAATIALQTIGSMFRKYATPTIKRVERFMEDSFMAAHNEIRRYAQQHILPDTPRTTIVACLIQNDEATWAHCGDSRLYWMRNGKVLERTLDHSRIEILIAQGKASPEERETHPDRNKLWNCLGANHEPQVNISQTVRLNSGDIFFLCSDGLWSMVSDEEISQKFVDNTIVRAVPELLSTSLRRAGNAADNTTALAMVWLGDDSLRNNSTVMQYSENWMDGEESLGSIVNIDKEIDQAINEIQQAIERSNYIVEKESKFLGNESNSDENKGEGEENDG